MKSAAELISNGERYALSQQEDRTILTQMVDALVERAYQQGVEDQRNREEALARRRAASPAHPTTMIGGAVRD